MTTTKQKFESNKLLMLPLLDMHRIVIVLVLILVTRGASGQTENILNSFNGKDGSYSLAPLVIDSSGNLYGTTEQGGSQGAGTAFELTNSGGNWTETVLWNFDGKSGVNPYDGLVLDSAGNYTGLLKAGAHMGKALSLN